MHLAVEPDLLDDIAVVDLERAAVVVEVDPRDVGDHLVGDHRGQAAAEELVLAVDAPAADDVVAFLGLGDKGGDVGRIVLEVGVHGDDPLASRHPKARREGRRLAEITPKANHLQPRVFLVIPLEQLEAAVAAPVVDDDHLIRPTIGFEGLGQPVVEFRDGFFLVEQGNDDGQVRVTHVATPPGL